MSKLFAKLSEPSAEPTFEGLRQAQETHNEIIVNYIQLAVFACVLVANVATLYLPVAPYRATPLMLSIIACFLLARVLLFFYLRGGPAYRPARKYLITALDLIVYTAAPLMLGALGAYPWLWLSLFSICTYAMIVALSGLRYSTNVVFLSGGATVVLHAALYTPLVSAEFRLPGIMVSCLTLGCVAVCTAYTAASLLRIHREVNTKDQLTRFLPPELVEQVAKDPGLLQRKTERRTATVVFTDIRGFTRFSERLAPENVVEFLNDFLEEMTSSIMDHQGMLDKYIGDAAMGVFGVPFHAEDHAERAYRAALDMRERLRALNASLVEKGLPELSIGIGLHTGELLIGAIGAKRRLDYTVIGDTVNVASRIEGMTRSYPVEILLSDSTREALAGEAALHRIATVQVKNRDEPLTLWSPDPAREAAAAVARADVVV